MVITLAMNRFIPFNCHFGESPPLIPLVHLLLLSLDCRSIATNRKTKTRANKARAIAPDGSPSSTQLSRIPDEILGMFNS